ncbi:hypothetical protein [Candidatus Aquarickettsia rohweri]|uniref:Uncharacterized protein n=1 Tax=Candidatus Aquarickettsia rohweri TaxID=2602574 RepID=A0A429XJ09_9RICK|nr:hypothetical protein [Candidatus Aquarickettsia rohweri]RST65976.1 hypothetical protein EIC27_03920 [Candidatus Aquarickettsia rohweri]
MVKYLVESEECSQKAYDDALKEAAARLNNLEIVKCLVKSGKCSQKVIKELLFNQDGSLKEKFNGIKEELIKNNYLDKNLLEGLISKEEINELSEKYQAQQEWRIKEDCMLMNNLNKVSDRNIINKVQNKIIAKTFKIGGLPSFKLTQYLNLDRYEKLLKTLDLNKKKAIEDKNSDKGSDNKNNESKTKENKKKATELLKKEACKNPNEEKVKHNEDEDDENDQDDTSGGQGGGNTASNSEKQQLQKDKNGNTYYINKNGERIDKMEESMEQPINEQAMEEITNDTLAQSIHIEFKDSTVTLLNKESIQQEDTLPMLYINDSKGMGMGVAMHSLNLNNSTEEMLTQNDETPHYAELL